MIYYHELAPQPKLMELVYAQYQQLNPQFTIPHHILQLEPNQDLDIVHDYVRAAGLELDNSKFFTCKPHFKTMVHTDSDVRRCALNIQVGPLGGLMYWFSAKRFASKWKAALQMKGSEIYVRMAYPEDVLITSPEHAGLCSVRNIEFTKDEIPDASLAMTVPTLVRVDEWHRIDNSANPSKRILYTLRLRGRHTLEELYARFKDVPTL